MSYEKPAIRFFLELKLNGALVIYSNMRDYFPHIKVVTKFSYIGKA
jgi:hypothetical protein